MTRSIERFVCAAKRCGIGCLLALGWGVWAHAGAPDDDAAMARTITTISLERDCNGCPSGSLLVLRRDGTAHHTQTGKPRLGTEDKRSRGTVSPKDFEALARIVVAQGFFALEEQYADPQTQDGSWSTIGVARGASDKQVFSRDAAGPPALKTIEAAIEALRARISFVPETR